MLDGAIRQFCVKHGIGPCGLVAAVSGGTDSTALLIALAGLRADGFSIACGHVNHRLRGVESDGDERFVRSLAGELGLDVHVADGTLDPSRVRARGVEAAAREVRYARLAEIREAAGARFVATAHQRNDQAETVLMRLVTGGGLAALRGIHPVREDGFIRPILDVPRATIEDFLASRGVTPRSDRSNADPRFLRNRIRSTLGELDAVDALAAIASQAWQVWPVLERAIDACDRSFVSASAGEARFRGWPDDPWLRQALLHRHIRRLDPDARDVSARDLERLAAEAGAIRRVSVTGALELVWRGGQAVLRRRPAAPGDFEIVLSEDSPARVPSTGRTMHLARIHSLPAGALGGKDRQIVEVPSDAGTFVVRNRRDGDRFQPLGMGEPKKLKELLIDRKIAAEDRVALPLLLWNGEIAWVAGVEVSERFKVTGRGGVLYEVWMEDAGDDDHGNQAGIHS